MKKRHTLRYSISIGLFFVFVGVFSQEKNADNTKKEETKKDTIIYKTGYGFRLGIDLSKPVISFFDSNYTGLELVGDYRIKKNWYLATELGFEDNTSDDDFINFTSKGTYIRIGANYNAYKNWLDMNNEIFMGLRYGFSLFEQTLNKYTPNIRGGYFMGQPIDDKQTTTGLNAHWAEFQLGIKAEILKNIFVGVSASYKIMIKVNEPTNFKSMYAPGFNRIYQSNTGFGFNYTLSYLIPFIKK